MEPLFVEQQRQFEQLRIAFQYLDEDTRKSLAANGAKSIPPQIVDLLSQMATRLETCHSRMNSVISATSPVDRDDLMRLFGDALIDARRTLDSVQERVAAVGVVACGPSARCAHDRCVLLLLLAFLQLLNAKSAEAHERSQRLNELFASQVEVLVRARARLTRVEGEVNRDETTFGEGSAAGDEARESLELAGAAVQEAESIGQAVVSRSGGLSAAVSGKGVGDLVGIEETLHQFAMSVARAVWTVGDSEATIRQLMQLQKERMRALAFKKMNMIGPDGVCCGSVRYCCI